MTLTTLAYGVLLVATQLAAFAGYLAALRWWRQRPRTRRLPSW